MTEQRLHDLLQERVADTVATDLVSGVWERAARTRRRRVSAIAGGVGATLAILGGVAVVTTSSDGERPEPPVTTPSESDPSQDASGGPRAVRAGSYGGADVWWAPSVEDEADLPALPGAPLPGSIDLSPGAPAVPSGSRALAVFQLAGDEPRRVVVLATDGTSYSLDASHLEPPDTDGNTAVQLTHDSLSPDGRHVFFVQPDALDVYDLETGDWTTIPAGEAYPRSARWEGGLIKVPEVALDAQYQLYRPTGAEAGKSYDPDVSFGPRPGDQRYGPQRIGTHDQANLRAPAQSFHLAGPVPTPDGGEAGTVEAVAASGPDGEALLATPTGQERWLEGMPVAGWLDAATVLLESRWAEAKVLAWRVGTPDLYRVADVVGWTPGAESYVASFADLSD